MTHQTGPLDKQREKEKPRVGISSCLLGNNVRYDGGHQRDRFLTDTLGQFVEWVPVCPEVECGLPTPRESMHLEGTGEEPRLVTSRTNRDVTQQMESWMEDRLDELEEEGLCGFIFKMKSPSSGMRDIPVFDEDGQQRTSRPGLFAGAFMERFPLLPVEDDGRLHDPGLRENFIERIFALKRYREAPDSVSGLVEFHSEHKLQIMAHNQDHLREMGQLVARASDAPERELFPSYEKHLLNALENKTTPPQNVNVLQHILGYFKDDLSGWEKQELLETIERYRKGLIPLIVPVTIIQHYVRKYEKEYLSKQTYLQPHPYELKLRNHA